MSETDEYVVEKVGLFKPSSKHETYALGNINDALSWIAPYYAKKGTLRKESVDNGIVRNVAW